MSVIWHDLECGSYTEDLGAVAGAGRRARRSDARRRRRNRARRARPGAGWTPGDGARSGCGAAGRAGSTRSRGCPCRRWSADARQFDSGERFPLCVVPMQTIQLLGGRGRTQAFLRLRARGTSLPDGVLAIAIAEELEPFELDDGFPAVLPDICERDGVVYSSQPTAVRPASSDFVLERRREVVGTGGSHTSTRDVIHLDRVTADAARAGGGGGRPAAERSRRRCRRRTTTSAVRW